MILLFIVLIILVLSLVLIFCKKRIKDIFNIPEPIENIKSVHNKLKLNHGNFNDELHEQKMILKHVNKDSKILEFGPNIGRSSLIANYKLNDSTQHLCVETLKDISLKLRENRDLNNMKFQIFNGAVSNTPLYQKKWGTTTVPTDGYIEVNTKPLNYILEKYNIKFNTIIADCEGCITQVLKDNEFFLKQINLIILEHDFKNENDLNIYINLMKKYNFKLVDKTLKKEIGLENWKDGVLSDPIFVSVWRKY